MSRVTKKKLSVSLSKEVIELMDEAFYNRSKFIEHTIVKELSKIDKFKERIDKMIL